MAKKREDVRQKILEYLMRCDNGASIWEIMNTVGLSRTQATYYLTKLAVEGKVVRKLKSPKISLWYIAGKEE